MFINGWVNVTWSFSSITNDAVNGAIDAECEGALGSRAPGDILVENSHSICVGAREGGHAKAPDLHNS